MNKAQHRSSKSGTGTIHGKQRQDIKKIKKDSNRKEIMNEEQQKLRELTNKKKQKS